MVTGVARLHKQFASVPVYVREEIEAAIEKMANEMVREMRSLAPLPEIKAAINWTWGDAPKGAMVVRKMGNQEYGKIQATVYVAKGLAFYAPWFEFGTAPRYHKSGKYVGQVIAQPFFFPVVRSNKKLFQGRIRRAINKGMKRANQSR